MITNFAARRVEHLDKQQKQRRQRSSQQLHKTYAGRLTNGFEMLRKSLICDVMMLMSTAVFLAIENLNCKSTETIEDPNCKSTETIEDLKAPSQSGKGGT